MVAERQVGVDPILQHGLPGLLQARPVGLRERLVGEVRERWPSPQRQRLAQALGRDRRATRRQRLPTLGRQRFEPSQVRLRALRIERVAAAPGEQEPVVDRLAQVRHVHLQRLGCRDRRVLTPQLVDQPIARNRLTRVQQQDRQHRVAA